MRLSFLEAVPPGCLPLDPYPRWLDSSSSPDIPCSNPFPFLALKGRFEGPEMGGPCPLMVYNAYRSDFFNSDRLSVLPLRDPSTD